MKPDLKKKLLAEVNEKNLQFFYDQRAVNGYYIYGGRKKPFGVVNFPEEFQKLRKMIANRDRRIWKVARGETVSATIDDSDTGTLTPVVTNIKFKVKLTPPSESLKSFTLPQGYEISLFAADVDFPDLENPVQIAFDARGRLFAADRSNNRIQLFDQEGTFLAQWTQFGRPSGIFFDEHDNIYVSDSESDDVQNPGWEMGIRIGDAKTGWVNYFVLLLTGDPRITAGDGAEFVVVDRDGNMYGGEPFERKIQKYVRVRR